MRVERINSSEVPPALKGDMVTLLQQDKDGGLSYEHFDAFAPCLAHLKTAGRSALTTVIVEGVKPESAGLLIGQLMRTRDGRRETALQVLRTLAAERRCA